MKVVTSDTSDLEPTLVPITPTLDPLATGRMPGPDTADLAGTVYEPAVAPTTFVKEPSTMAFKALAVLAAILVLAVGGLSYALYQSSANSATALEELRNRNSDLKAQLNEIAAAAHPSPTPSPLASISPMVLTEFSVKFVPASNLSDLQYKATSSGGNMVLGFTTTSLLAKYKACTAGAALGYLSRASAGTRPAADEVLVATVGRYAYFYTSSKAPCSSDASEAAQQTALSSALASSLKGLAAQ